MSEVFDPSAPDAAKLRKGSFLCSVSHVALGVGQRHFRLESLHATEFDVARFERDRHADCAKNDAERAD